MNLRGILHSLGIRARVLVLAVVPVAVVATLLGYHLATSRLHDAEQSLAERQLAELPPFYSSALLRAEAAQAAPARKAVQAHRAGGDHGWNHLPRCVLR